MADKQKVILIGNNSDHMQAYKVGSQGTYYQAKPEDAYALIMLKDGTTYKHEFYYGSTYLSQSSRSIKFTPAIKKVVITDFAGRRKEALAQ